jgi:hypothetical protein
MIRDANVECLNAFLILQQWVRRRIFGYNRMTVLCARRVEAQGSASVAVAVAMLAWVVVVLENPVSIQAMTPLMRQRMW